MLSLAFVTGTEPGKWFKRFIQSTPHTLDTQGGDDPFAELVDQATPTSLALMRLPDERVTEDYHVVRLYKEAPGVAVPKGSLFAEIGERVDYADLEGEIVNWTYGPQAPIDELRAALQVVAANVGVALAPLPLLKMLSKKQIACLEVRDAPCVETEIALVWRKSDDCDVIQDFVGVAKGRTVRSSRGGEQATLRKRRKQVSDSRNAQGKRSYTKRGEKRKGVSVKAPRTGVKRRRRK